MEDIAQQAFDTIVKHDDSMQRHTPLLELHSILVADLSIPTNTLALRDAMIHALDAINYIFKTNTKKYISTLENDELANLCRACQKSFQQEETSIREKIGLPYDGKDERSWKLPEEVILTHPRYNVYRRIVRSASNLIALRLVEMCEAAGMHLNVLHNPARLLIACSNTTYIFSTSCVQDGLFNLLDKRSFNVVYIEVATSKYPPGVRTFLLRQLAALLE